jgi:redox-sensitive bicupin YhaK (pirin superfamily)
MTMVSSKAIVNAYQPGSTHMVGDGFDVRNMFPSNNLGPLISPFLLLDYAEPTYYAPNDQPRGVGEHPHRGFETVTIVYQGAVDHRDSAGNAGTIGPGDVQWMTAASGVVHEEKHQKNFAKQGGTLEAIQLWVNLPKAFKMEPPRYQTILNHDISIVPLAEGAGSLRVIAGEFKGRKGPATTFTPIQLYDLHLKAGHRTELTVPSGYNTALFVLHGQVLLNNTQSAHSAELVLFDKEGDHIVIDTQRDATVLLLSGEPIHEPVASYGPFVMTTQAEILQAMNDYRAGKMGHLS